MPVSDLIQTYQRVVSIMRFLNSLAWVIRGKSNVRHLKFLCPNPSSFFPVNHEMKPHNLKPEQGIQVARVIPVQSGFLVEANQR